MEPNSLHLAGVLLTFTLKVGAGFLLCLGLVHLLPSPRHRFLAWLGFLLGSGLSWMALFANEVVSFLSRTESVRGLATSVTKAGGKPLAIPISWGAWISRGAIVLGAVYLAGAAMLLMREAIKHFRLRALLKQGRQPSTELEEVFRAVCSDLNVRRCRVIILPQASSPATVYWWTPRVVLPEVCEDLVSTPQLKNVLRHELVHTLRCDYLWATLGNVLCAILFFHPAVWQARKQLIMQRELACDLAVVEATPEERADYAHTLTQFVRLLMLRQGPKLGVDFAAAPSLLGTRIRCILAGPPLHSRWKKLVADAGFVACIILFASASPALSISFEFARPMLLKANSQPSLVLTGPTHLRSKRARLKVPRKRMIHAPVSEPYEDNLTTLPVKNAVKGAEFSGPDSDVSESMNLEEELVPGRPGLSTPSPTSSRASVGEVVIAGLGGIPGVERPDHRGGRRNKK